jgi:glycosyltransferase involved in cell wall biosynthesis
LPGKALILVENLTVPFDRRVWMECGALRRAGWQVSVICPTGESHQARYEELEGVHIYRYPPPPPAAGLLGYAWEFAYCWLRTAWLSLRVLRRHGFDVIHACNPPDTFWLLGRMLRPFGKRFLFDQHDLCPEVYLARFGSDREGGLPHRGLLWLEQRTYRTADAVVATNESYRQVALDRGRVRPDRCFVVRSAPSRERFAVLRPVDPSLKRGRRFLVAYLGVMAPQDGVDHLIRAAHHLVRERARGDVSFTLIGAGDSFHELQGLTRRLGLEDFIQFTGRIPDAEVEVLLATADVCVSPDPKNPLNDVSTMNKVLEYMACGRPLVAFDLRETRISAGEGALYATPNRDEELAACIETLLDDAERRRRMGEYNRQRFLEQMAWEYSVTQLIAAYEKSCAPRDA